MGLRLLTIALAGLVMHAAVAGAAQRHPTGLETPAVAITIALKADEKVYNFTGRGQCVHAPAVSIYGLRAERWTAARTGDAPGASLVVWRPASGDYMVSLAFTIGETRYSMSTVKVGNKGTREGSGTVAFARDGAGGTFTVQGTAGNGARISGSVTCAAFAPEFAEGGN